MLDKTKRFLRTLQMICILSFAMDSFCLYAIPSGVTWIVLVTVSITGVVMISVIPTAYSFSVELTHPTPPALVNGLMLMFANLFALTFSFFAAFLANISPKYAILSLSISSGLTVLCSLFVKEVLKRSKGHPAVANLMIVDT